MEAVLLPSPDVKKLCEKAVVVAVRRSDPACAELRKEFDIPYLNSFAIVLNPRGETMTSFMADTAGRGCTKESSDKFPEMVVAKIEDGLRKADSLQDLERRVESSPSDAAALKELQARIEEVTGFARLGRFLDKISVNPDLPAQVRADLRIQAFMARSRAPGIFTSRESKTRLAEEGEKLLVDLADHPGAEPIASTLFNVAYASQFDVPSKSAAGIERLRRQIRDHQKPSALRAVVDTLEKIRATWIERTEAARHQGEGKGAEFTRAYNGVMLGDAPETVRFFGQPPYDRTPLYKTWVKEARERLEREF